VAQRLIRCLPAEPKVLDVGFAVPAEAYDRFMGRYSHPLAPMFADFVGVVRGWRVLDVGCGPGALMGELVARVGERSVTGVDPSASFVEAARARYPGVEVQLGGAEELALADATFDAALAQLVVHFMADPVRGLKEMARVTVPGGVVGACVWDYDEGGSPLSPFWTAARQLDPSAPGEATLPGARRGHLAELMREAGLGSVKDTMLAVDIDHPTFDDWWQPFELGVGPAGAYVSSLGALDRTRLREHCREVLPEPPFTVTAAAWAARGIVQAHLGHVPA
jgi:SAM-dependent methyltransferase